MQFWREINSYAHTFEEKNVLLCCEKNEIESKLIFIESLIFFFFFFLILQKIDTPNVTFYLPTEKTFFTETYTIQYRLSLFISKSVRHNFAEKYAKIIVFLATMIHLWCTLTSLCTVISGSWLRRLLFVIIIPASKITL